MTHFSAWLRLDEGQETTFLGWKDFLHELNIFVNDKVRQNRDQWDYVTLASSTPRAAVLHVYLEPDGTGTHKPDRLLAAVKYFATDHGLRVTGERRDTDPQFPNSVLLKIEGLERTREPGHYGGVKNPWLRKALRDGRVIDVRQSGTEVEPGVFRIEKFYPGVDYYDSRREAPIFSIGKDVASGEIFAAHDLRFYDDPDYECLYVK